MYDESLKKNPHHTDYMIYVVEDDVAQKKLYFFLFTFPTPYSEIVPSRIKRQNYLPSSDYNS